LFLNKIDIISGFEPSHYAYYNNIPLDYHDLESLKTRCMTPLIADWAVPECIVVQTQRNVGYKQCLSFSVKSIDTIVLF